MATFKTYAQSNKREQLEDAIYRIDPEETPILTLAKKNGVTAENTKYEWNVSTLQAARDDNALAEGANYGDANPNLVTRMGNHTQIFHTTIDITKSAARQKTAGPKEWSRQTSEKAAELKLDMEKTIVSNKPSSAGNATTGARQLAGLESIISTNVNMGATGVTGGWNGSIFAAPTDGTPRALTENILKANIQQIWAAGGTPSKLFVPAAQKVVISGFSGGATKYQEVDAKRLTAAVDFYVSDFGTHEIIPHRLMRTRTVLNLDPKHIKLAVYRSMETVDQPSQGDYERKVLVTEATLVVNNEKACGKISDLS